MSEDNQDIDTGGLYLDDLAVDGRPNLGSLQMVDKLVRDFAAFVFDVRAGFHEGRPGLEDPLRVIENEARRNGAIVLGKDPAYCAQPWHHPNRLGMTLTVLFPKETKHYGDPGTALFMWFAAQVALASEAVESGSMSEDRAKEQLAPVVDDVVSRILGVK